MRSHPVVKYHLKPDWCRPKSRARPAGASRRRPHTPPRSPTESFNASASPALDMSRRRASAHAARALARRARAVAPLARDASSTSKPLEFDRLRAAFATTADAAPRVSATVDIESANAPEAPTRAELERRPRLSLVDAARWVKANAKAKFAESVEFAVHLGVDPKRSDMIVRGAVRLPHGTGKTVRVAVFAEGEDAEAARDAGATTIGGAALVDEIKEGGSGTIQFDKAIATPGMMSKLKEIARILGPRGLMPNPKLGTVTTDVAEAVREHLGGRVEFRAEKNAIVHVMVGKVNFEEEHLVENVATVFRELLALRPKGKGAPNASKYVRKAYLSSTMGKGSARLEVSDLVDAASALK